MTLLGAMQGSNIASIPTGLLARSCMHAVPQHMTSAIGGSSSPSCDALQVFEFMESDLEAVIRSRAIVLSPAHVKAYMQIILESLDFCHKRWVLHRDIKPNNMLVSGGGELGQATEPAPCPIHSHAGC